MQLSGGRQAFGEDLIDVVAASEERTGAYDDVSVLKMLHVNAAGSELKHGFRRRSLKGIRKLGQIDEIRLVGAISAIPRACLDPSTDGLDPLYFENELAFRCVSHRSICPLSFVRRSRNASQEDAFAAFRSSVRATYGRSI